MQNRAPDRPFRILCFLHAPDRGGVERVAIKLCRGWRGLGAEVDLLFGHAGKRPSELPEQAIVAARRARVLITALKLPWMLLLLRRQLRIARPDVLFCAGNTYAIVAVLLRMMLGQACPPIVAKISNSLVRTDLPRPVRAIYGWWCRIQGRWIDHFVALTAEQRSEIAYMLGVSLDRVTAIANPVLEEDQRLRLGMIGQWARASRSPSARRFLAAGRLEPQKNFPLLLRAFAAGHQPGDRLTILGAGSERTRLQRLLRKLDLEERVALPGYQSDIAPWLARTDAVVLSSDYEGLPGILIEALAAGLPVISTICCSGLPALIDDATTGQLVRTGDAAALAAAIDGFDPAAYDRDQAMARAGAFSVAASSPAFLRLMRAVAGRNEGELPEPLPDRMVA